MVNSNQPSWNQTFVYSGVRPADLRSRILEVTVWDYDRFGSNEFLGEVLLDLSNINVANDEEPLWHLLNLHQNAGGELTTVPPICPTPGLMVSRWLVDRPNGLLLRTSYIHGALKIPDQLVFQFRQLSTSRIFSVDCKSTQMVYFEKGGSLFGYFCAFTKSSLIQSVKTR